MKTTIHCSLQLQCEKGRLQIICWYIFCVTIQITYLNISFNSHINITLDHKLYNLRRNWKTFKMKLFKRHITLRFNMRRLLLLTLIKVTGERDNPACWDRGDKVNVAWRQRWLTDVILALALDFFNWGWGLSLLFHNLVRCLPWRAVSKTSTASIVIPLFSKTPDQTHHLDFVGLRGQGQTGIPNPIQITVN